MRYFLQIYRNKYAFAFLALVFVLAIITLIFFNNPFKISRADSIGSLDGWAWSSNIGWVSLNCQDRSVCSTSDYKVQVNPSDGKLSGHAWSSSIGWIKFNPAGPYPENPQTSAVIDLTTGAASGWLRALSYGDGWDGWIKITDAKVNNGKFEGWAWGSLVVGWLNFWNVNIPNINVQCDFSANPSSIVRPQTSTLSWACQYASSCSIDQGIGSVDNVSGTQSLQPSKTTTYTLTCSGTGGPSIKSATVSVSMPKIEIKEVAP